MTIDEINLNQLIDKAKDIRNAIKDIKEYTKISLNNFLKEKSLIDSTKYKFIVGIESCIAICNHLASRLAEKVPESYSDCFKIILELGAISNELANNLMKMSKFRNLLIHLYWKIDDSKVYKIAKTNINDLEEFLNQIGNFLKEKI